VARGEDRAAVMAEIVNLNRARKAKAKADAGKAAEANRAKFGRSKVERDAAAADKARRDALLDGAKREEDPTATLPVIPDLIRDP